MVSAFAVGGETELFLRLMVPYIAYYSGRTITLEVSTGEGGATALGTLHGNKTDGSYIVTAQTPSYIISPMLPDCPYRLEDVSVLSFNTFTPHLLLVHTNSSFTSWTQIIETAKRTKGGLKIGGVPPAQEIFHRQLIGMNQDVESLHFVNCFSAANSMAMIRSGELQITWGTPPLYLLNTDLVRPIVVSSKIMLDCLPQVPSLTYYGFDVTVGVDRGLAVSAAVPETVKAQLAEWFSLAGQNRSFLAEVRANGFMPEFLEYPATSDYVTLLYNEYHSILFKTHHKNLAWLFALVPSVVGVVAVAGVIVTALLLYRRKRRMLLVDFERDMQEQMLKVQTPAATVLKTLLELKRHVPRSYESQIVEAARLLVSTSLNKVDIGKADLEEDATAFLKGLMTLDMHSDTTSSDLCIQPIARTVSRRLSESNMPWCYDNYDYIMNTAPQFTAWDYAPERATDAMDGHVLQAFVTYFFVESGVTTAFSIELSTLCHFAEAVENSYIATNPFHNAVHAADVLQAMWYFLTKTEVISLKLPIECVFVALVSAVIHDCNHTGRTNAFMIETHSELALTYNDASVLENHHLATFFKICTLENQNIFRGIPVQKQKAMRKRIIEVVLATDLSGHFAFLSHLKNKLSVSFSPTSCDEDMSLLLRTLIKCGDLSNPARPEVISRWWTANISEEFFQQGDEEKLRGMKVSAFMDRNEPRVARSQVLFIDNVVMQLWQLCSQMIHVDDLVAVVASNRAAWERKAALESLASH
eukprot:TRINITY_DN18382_c0_g1_i1.p1 TRINITY_DN18382_c0_g1~~TRINITY_DN18382_c0_g1_i1.p1  ORF type:complete len:830 (+),score=205.85 TRINITY_DN18382_c0_g1_i1:223-2490(+)